MTRRKTSRKAARVTAASIDMSKVTAVTVARLRNRVRVLTAAVEVANMQWSFNTEDKAAATGQAKAVEVARRLLAQFHTGDRYAQIGSHVGALIVTYTGEVEPRNQIRRATWLLDWLIDYFLQQDLSVNDFANDNGQAAVEALAVVAAQVRQPREVPWLKPEPASEWGHVRNSAMDTIEAII